MEKHSFLKERWEAIASVSAIIMAAAAVVVSLYEASLMREHQHLTVKPAVWVHQNVSADLEKSLFSYVIANQGLGPARIEHFEIRFKDEVIHDWGRLITLVTGGNYDLNNSDQFTGRTSSSISRGRVIPAGESVMPMEFKALGNLPKYFKESGDDISLSVCVCSVYNECAVSVLGKRPKEVAACKVDHPDHF